jgi:hypothetical protein
VIKNPIALSPENKPIFSIAKRPLLVTHFDVLEHHLFCSENVDLKLTRTNKLDNPGLSFSF